MESQEEKKTGKTWQPTTAGILAIISGAVAVVYGLVLAVLGAFAGGLLGLVGLSGLGGFTAAVALIPLILGILAMVGGVYALRRKSWGLALTGSICALISPLGFLGILAIIFVSMGKGEFK